MTPRATKTQKRPSAQVNKPASEVRASDDGQAIITAMHATASAARATKFDPFGGPLTS